MTFAQELQDPAGIPCDHPLKSGCLGIFLLGILFSIIFLITVFIQANQSNIVVFYVVLIITTLTYWIQKNLLRTLHFQKDGMTITTLFFGTQRVEAVPSTAIKLVTGAGQALGGRATRIRYHILVKTQSGKTLKPGFREFDYVEINRNIEELALLIGVAWVPCDEYVFDPD